MEKVSKVTNTPKKYIRKLDNVGRISVPPKVFDAMEIFENTNVIIFIDKITQDIVLKKYDSSCIFCGTKENTFMLHDFDFYVCKNCNKEDIAIEIVRYRYKKVQIPKGRRLNIPSNIRKVLNISVGDSVSLFMEDKNTLRIQPVKKQEVS